MAKIFKTLLLLVILAFEDANGRPPTKGMTDGKFFNSQQSVTKDRYLLNTKRIYFVCQSEVYLFKILSSVTAEERFLWERTLYYPLKNHYSKVY